MKKKALQLSMNMIIITIIAIVTLGIILAFVTGALGNLLTKVPHIPNTPCGVSAENPVQVIPGDLEIKRGGESGIAICFYNDGDAVVSEDILPILACQGLDGASLTAKGQEVGIGSVARYEGVLGVPQDAVKKLYPCSLNLANEALQFTIKLK